MMTCVDTGGPVCPPQKPLKITVLEKVIAYCTHPVLSGKAIETLQIPWLDELVVTDTIPLDTRAL